MGSTLGVGLLLAGAWGLAQPQAEQGRPTGERRLFHDFEDPRQRDAWEGWSLDQEVAIELASPGFDSDTGLRFSVAKAHWDTAIVSFDPPVRATDSTMVRFKLRADRSGGYGLNVRNATEGAEYYIAFTVVETGWITVQKYLKSAVYKRFGKEGVDRDGMVGDDVSSIQIAYLGSEMLLDDFEIVDVDNGAPELPRDSIPFEGDYTPRKYDCLDEVFPFGVIGTVAAGDGANGRLFGQTMQERFEDDVIDLKRRHMNALANFCDDGAVAWRLSVMERHHMYLVETVLSNTDLGALPDDDSRWRLVEQARDHPRMLAWYGRDEPTDYAQYLASKLALDERDPNHPMASAFNEMYAAKMLGPFMELIMLNHYSVRPGSRSVDALAFHADLIRAGREYCAGGKVWLIAQAFSARNRQTTVWRMPHREEIRFEVYNALAAGVEGFLFFIYNDECPYLDGRTRGEEFDDTLVDPWGNAHPVYEELAGLAEALAPALPSLLNARDAGEDGPTVAYPEDRLALGRLRNGAGTHLVFANKDLEEPFRGAVRVTPSEGQRLYDLVSRREQALLDGGYLPLGLEPGGGAIVTMTTPENWARVRAEIEARELRREWELLDVEVKLAEAAGLSVARCRRALDEGPASRGELARIWDELGSIEEGNAGYRLAKTELGRIKERFGEVHRLIRPVVGAVEGTEDEGWLRTFDGLKAASVQYFDAWRRWKRGEYPSEGQLAGIAADVEALQERVREQVAELR